MMLWHTERAHSLNSAECTPRERQPPSSSSSSPSASSNAGWMLEPALTNDMHHLRERSAQLACGSPHPVVSSVAADTSDAGVAVAGVSATAAVEGGGACGNTCGKHCVRAASTSKGVTVRGSICGGGRH